MEKIAYEGLKKLQEVGLSTKENVEVLSPHYAGRVSVVSADSGKDFTVPRLVFFAVYLDRTDFAGCSCSINLRETRVGTLYIQVLIDECGDLARRGLLMVSTSKR